MLPVTLSPIVYAQPILKFRWLPTFGPGLALSAAREALLAGGIPYLLVPVVAWITLVGRGHLAPLGFTL
jgi:hypothetical protein